MSQYPVNQVFLGNSPYPNDIESQLEQLKLYEEKLLNLRTKHSNVDTSMWNTIDSEITPLTIEQKQKLFTNEEYMQLNAQLQELVQNELLSLVKGKIETSDVGNQLLKSQLELIKTLKGNIVRETNKEMELFMKFKEFSKQNPEVTYEAFVKSNMQ